MDAPKKPIGRDFGQHEPLTTRLRNLVRNYPKGLGIFKEFIQNADDAEADEIVFVIDEQHYEVSGLPKNTQWIHTGPALLVYNNRPFSDEDIKGIQKLGTSGKSDSVGKTGRFGLGFNSCYNVTDVPYWFTKDELFFFDPHFSTVPETSEKSPGKRFNDDELSQFGWPFLNALIRFRREDTSFNGTVFRLPFRTSQRVAQSEISDEPYTVKDALQAVKELQAVGSAILLFLKHINQLTVEHRDPEGRVTELLSFRATNKEEISDSREEVNTLLNNPDPEEILNQLAELGSFYSSCRHEYSVNVNRVEHTEAWQVVDGFFVDDESKVLDASREMLKKGQKAIPYAGAAWPLDFEQNPGGRIYCSLPVPIQTSMPVQLNGYFDLDDSRQNMFLDQDVSGLSRHRVEWNETLLQTSVARAYVQLLKELRSIIGEINIDSYYSAFPEFVSGENAWESWLTRSFYELASKAKLHRRSGEERWCGIEDLRYLPYKLKALKKVLIEENCFPLADPQLPGNVKEGYDNIGVTVEPLSPSELCQGFKVESDFNCRLDESPRPALKSCEHVKALFKYCTTEVSFGDLVGLPLIIDADGQLRTIGKTEQPLFWTKDVRDLEIFAEYSYEFVDVEFAEIVGSMKASSRAQGVKPLFYPLDETSFIEKLNRHVKPIDPETSIKLGDKGITEGWLHKLFARLVDLDLMGHDSGTELCAIPLIPDQDGNLRCMGDAATPMLFEGPEKLKTALLDLKVPLVVDIGDQLLNQLRAFSDKTKEPPRMAPGSLVCSLEQFHGEELRQYDQVTEVQNALLNYLSEKKSVEELKQQESACTALKLLQIFPTNNGELIDLNQEAYTSVGFEFPPIDFDIALLNVGNKKWRDLYRVLKVKGLSRSLFIRRYLLKHIAECDVSNKIKALVWLRDNFNKTKDECDEREFEELLDEIRSTSIIVCEDGQFRAPKSVYSPRCKLAREVFGSEAAFPDMDRFDHQEIELWHTFFRQLNLSEEVLLDDVVDYVIKQIDEPYDSTQRTKLQEVWKHIAERVGNELKTGDGLSEELSAALTRLSLIGCVPVLQSSNKFLCLMTPESELARPTEVYIPQVGCLIASQAPIADLGFDLIQKVAKSMGFRETAPVSDVAAHFSEVLKEHPDPNISLEDDLGNFDSTFSEIYQFIGRQNSKDLSVLKTVLSTVPCILDPKNRRFLRPNQVFFDDVKYMEPWRWSIPIEDKYILDGYRKLGVNKTPDINDFKEVLDEISERNQAEVKSNIDVVRRVLSRIIEELKKTKSVDKDVFVPVRNGTLQPACKVFVPDASWHENKYDSWGISILEEAIFGIDGIERCLGLQSLARSIVSELKIPPKESGLKEPCDECTRLQELVRSPEFLRGTKRLLSCGTEQFADSDLGFLQSVRVKCFESMKQNLYCVIEGERQFLDEGEDEGDHHWNSDERMAMLVENRSGYFHLDLAKLLKQKISDNASKELSLLSDILKLDPSKIRGFLDDQKIPNLPSGRDLGLEKDLESVSSYFPIQDQNRTTPGSIAEKEEQAESQEEIDGVPDVVGDDENSELIPVSDIDDDQPLSSDESEHEGDAQREEDSSYPEQPAKSDQSEHPSEVSTASRRRKSDTSQGGESSGTDRSGGGAQEEVPTGTRPNQPSKSEGGSGAEKNDASKDIEDAVSESTASRRQSSRQSRLGSYVSPKDGNGEPEESTEDQQRRIQKVDKGAVSIVLEHEKEQGRIATEMPHENEGYDVKSEDGGQTRYIEVKGTDQSWGETGVALTKKQFAYAQDYPERNFWLYVVENVSSNPQLYKIQDPAGKVDRFFFDGGWRQAAVDLEGIVDEMPLPSPGDEVLIDGKVVGVVEQILKSGKLPLVIYKDIDGKQQRKLLSEVDIRPRED
jgi:hypothetical protein